MGWARPDQAKLHAGPRETKSRRYDPIKSSIFRDGGQHALVLSDRSFCSLREAVFAVTRSYTFVIRIARNPMIPVRFHATRSSIFPSISRTNRT